MLRSKAILVPFCDHDGVKLVPVEAGDPRLGGAVGGHRVEVVVGGEAVARAHERELAVGARESRLRGGRQRVPGDQQHERRKQAGRVPAASRADRARHRHGPTAPGRGASASSSPARRTRARGAALHLQDLGLVRDLAVVVGDPHRRPSPARGSRTTSAVVGSGAGVRARTSRRRRCPSDTSRPCRPRPSRRRRRTATGSADGRRAVDAVTRRRARPAAGSRTRSGSASGRGRACRCSRQVVHGVEQVRGLPDGLEVPRGAVRIDHRRVTDRVRRHAVPRPGDLRLHQQPASVQSIRSSESE